MRSFLVVAATAAAVVAIAVPARSALADTGLHGGLNLRADSGAHPVRVTGGIDTGPVDVAVTLDPMVVFDGQFDADLLTTSRLTDNGWGAIVGWRSTSLQILGGRQLQEKLVLGIAAPLPAIGDLPIRARWALEVATVILKHGGGLPSDWISFQQGRDFVDLINFGMFITVELGRADR
jgi:hypothetical protein